MLARLVLHWTRHSLAPLHPFEGLASRGLFDSSRDIASCCGAVGVAKAQQVGASHSNWQIAELAEHARQATWIVGRHAPQSVQVDERNERR